MPRCNTIGRATTPTEVVQNTPPPPFVFLLTQRQHGREKSTPPANCPLCNLHKYHAPILLPETVEMLHILQSLCSHMGNGNRCTLSNYYAPAWLPRSESRGRRHHHVEAPMGHHPVPLFRRAEAVCSGHVATSENPLVKVSRKQPCSHHCTTTTAYMCKAFGVPLIPQQSPFTLNARGC